VLISDADPSLYLTAACVAHLQEAYYPAATVFGSARARLDPGVPGAPAAGRDDVLAAVAGRDPGNSDPDNRDPDSRDPNNSRPDESEPAARWRPRTRSASLLHFGCHGRVAVPVLGSSLRLGRGPDGGELTVSVRDMLRRARAAVGRGGDIRAEANRTDGRTSESHPGSRVSGSSVSGSPVGDSRERSSRERDSRGDDSHGGADGDGGLVVLASCLTDVTETDYDEALTLASAFLAAGAAGVCPAPTPPCS
jgi:hypothetical protein